MVKYTEEQNRVWRESLPKKQIAVKVIAYDKDGKVLLVKPKYRDYWHNPGGGVDKDESPLSAAIREFREEVGLSIDAGKLKLIELLHGAKYDDLVAIYEFCKPIDPSEIVVQDNELEGFEMVETSKAGDYLSPRMGEWWMKRLLRQK